MNISFDFDGTLSEPHIQMICKDKLNAEHNVFIITKRYTNQQEAPQVFKLAQFLGIKNSNIIFTNRSWKVEFIKRLSIDEHYEDEDYERELIEAQTNCKVIMVNEIGVFNEV